MTAVEPTRTTCRVRTTVIYPVAPQSHVVVIVVAAHQSPFLAQICNGLIVGLILRQHVAEQPCRL